MNFKLKVLAAGVLLAMAGQASATVQFDSAGGELFLTVSFLDQASGASKSYIEDLGVQVSSFLATGGTRPNAGTNTYSGSGANNAGTVAAPATGAGSVNTPGYSVSWLNPSVPGLFGSDFSNAVYQVYAGIPQNTLATPGTFLSTTNDSTVTSMSNNEALGLKNITTFMANANSSGTMPATVAVNGSFYTADPNNSGNVNKTLGTGWNSKFVAGGNSLDASAAVGTGLSFYQIQNSSSVASATAKVIPFAGTWLLNQDGTLTYSVAAVPEPSGVAMLLAGLGVIGLIARRRING